MDAAASRTLPQPDAPSAGRAPALVVAIALGVPLLLLLASSIGYFEAGEDEQFTGYHRQDFIYYSSNAREVFDNGNGLTYGYPFSAADDAPRVYSHLQLLLFGWLWKATGVSLPVLWQVGQVVFGAAMFLALWQLVVLLLPARERVYGFAVLSLGGGLATLQAALRTAFGDGGEALGFLHTVHVEGGGWFPNVFQNAQLTTEAFYHVLAFWTFACVLRGQRGRALLGVFLVWWSHPFTGLEVAGIVGAFALLEAWRERDRATLAWAASIALVSGLFLGYYVVGLRWLSPEAADILDRWRTAPYLLALSQAPAMWGVFLAWPIFVWRDWRRSAGAAEAADVDAVLAPALRRSDRFLVIWMLVVGALLLHDRLLPEGVEPYQPMHFSHGYFFVPIAILTLRGLFAWTRAWPPARRRAAAAAFLLFVSADSVSFALGTFVYPDKPMLSGDAVALLDRLAEDETPRNVLTLGRVPIFRDMLGVVTPHRTYLLNAFQTAWFGRKRAALRAVAASPAPAALCAELGISWVAGPRALLEHFRGDLDAGRVSIERESGPLQLLRIRMPVAARPASYELSRFPLRAG